MESTHEIGEIAKTDFVSNIGHRLFAAGKKPRSTAQPRTNEILMRGSADDPGEKAQEVKSGKPALLPGRREINFLMGVGVDPMRRIDDPFAIAGPDALVTVTVIAVDVCYLGKDGEPDLFKRQIGFPRRRCIGKFAEHHEIGAWRQSAVLPATTHFLHQFRYKLEAQAFIAPIMMIVRTDIFLARASD